MHVTEDDIETKCYMHEVGKKMCERVCVCVCMCVLLCHIKINIKLW
jgi:hypothetical protein